MRKVEARWQERKGESWTEWGDLTESTCAEFAYLILTVPESGWNAQPEKITVERGDGFRTQYRLAP